jgi:tetratricopeptide (TPR) repeat protein
MAEGYAHPSYKGLALLGLGTFCDFSGENKQSIAYLEQALEVFESLNDDQNATVVLNNIGIYYRRVCMFGRAEKYFRQAYMIAKDNADLEMQTRCLRNMALVANRNDDFSRSVNLIAECVRLAERVNDRRLLSQAYRTQADIFMLLNNMENAAKLYGICEEICKGTEDKVELARCLCGLGELAAGKQQPDNAQALVFFAEALKAASAIGYKKGIALASYGQGLIYRRLGDFARATERLGVSVAIFKQLEHKVMHVRALAQAALCECYAGQYDRSFSTLTEALAITEEHNDKKGTALVNDTLEAVTELGKLLGQADAGYGITLKAQRHLATGEVVGTLLTVTENEVRVVGDGKKASNKVRPEMVSLTWGVQPALKVDLDRTPKRLLFLRCAAPLA